MRTPALAAQVSRPGRVALVEVVIIEPLDVRAVPHLHALLDGVLALRPDHLVVDLAGCPSIDASGISVLLDVHRQAMHNGCRLSLREPSAQLYRKFELARAAQVLHVIRLHGEVPAQDWCAAASAGAVTGPPAA